MGILEEDTRTVLTVVRSSPCLAFFSGQIILAPITQTNWKIDGMILCRPALHLHRPAHKWNEPYSRKKVLVSILWGRGLSFEGENIPVRLLRDKKFP